MPGAWIVQSFLQFATCSLLYDSFWVHSEWAALLLEFDFRAEDRSHGLWLVEEVLCVVSIGSSWSLVVLHDALWSEEVVDQVWSEWNYAPYWHDHLGTGIRHLSHLNPLISHDDCLLKILHALGGGQLTASRWIKSVHFYTLFIIN